MKNTIKRAACKTRLVLLRLCSFSPSGLRNMQFTEVALTKLKFCKSLKILGIIVLAMVIGVSMASASENTARFIDEYERFVNEYVEIVQKMLAGDMAAAMQAQALETRVQEMERRFNNLSESDFTPAQVQKYAELTERITRAFGF